MIALGTGRSPSPRRVPHLWVFLAPTRQLFIRGHVRMRIGCHSCSAARADFNSAKWNFAQRLMSRNVPDNVVLRMLGVDHFLGRIPRSQVAREFCRDNSLLVSEASSVITLVLRFHPVLLQAKISRILCEEFSNSFLALRYLCGGDYTPRLSWSRAGPALFSRCRSAYREKGWQQHFSIQWV